MKTAIELANECQLLDGLSISPSQAVRYAALVEAAYIERLLAAVEMPEPVRVNGEYEYAYTTEQLRETVASAVARKDAEIEHLKDKLDSSVHGHNQIFELCQVLETERDALKVEVKRLTEERESWRRVCEKITTERDALKAEKPALLTTLNDRQRLEAIVAVVCKYLPPDGISREDAMSEIIGLIDPLPDQGHIAVAIRARGKT